LEAILVDSWFKRVMYMYRFRTFQEKASTIG